MENISNELLTAKVVSMIVLGLVSFLLGILPIRLAKWLRWEFNASRSRLILSLLLCFGGGVLLYTTFLHLQPEVREGVEALQKSGVLPTSDHHIHLAELIFCCGFFFVYLVEELVHVFLDSRHEAEDEAVLHRTMSIRKCGRHPTENNTENSTTNNSTNLIPRVSLSGKVECGSNSTQGLISSSTLTLTKASPLDAEMRMTGGPLTISNTVEPEPPKQSTTIIEQQQEQPINIPKFKQYNGHSHTIPMHHHHHHHDVNTNSSGTVATSFRGLLAVLALSFHAVFEGLAVGLETSVANVWYLFAAIATHKLVIAFCVGVELMNSGTRKCLVVLYVATFAVVSPLGIGIGIAVAAGGSGSGTETAATVILQGMAAGTLVYVVFFEVLQRERANTQSGFFQLVAIMAGFAIMLVLQLITGHNHNHGPGEDHDHDHHHHNHDDHTHGVGITHTIQNVTEHVLGSLANHLAGTTTAGVTESSHHHDHDHDHDH